MGSSPIRVAIVGRSRARHAAIAQLVERILGKDEVPSSNLGSSSKEKPCNRFGYRVFLFVGEREPRQKTAFQLIGQLFGAAYPCLSIGTQGMAGSYLSNRDPIAEKKKTFGFIEQE